MNFQESFDMFYQESTNQQQQTPAAKKIAAPPSGRLLATQNPPENNEACDPNFSPLSMTEHAMQIFKELRDNSQLTDVTLIADDGTKFSAHKPLLAACSNYFKAIFTRPFREMDQKELKFERMPAAIMKELLEFVYVRKVGIGAENVEELLEWADYLNMGKLVRLCCHFMVDRISVARCLGLMNIARHYHYDDLYRQALNYATDHFEEVASTSDEFLELDASDLKQLLANDRLNVSNEAKVWTGTKRWLNHDPTRRVPLLPTLIKTIRLALCTQTLLETIRQDPLVADNEECRQWVGSAYKLVYGFESHVTDEEMYALTNHNVWSPRIPSQVILAVGGWSGGSATSVFESYDERANEWLTLPYDDPSGSRAYHGCCAFGNNLYIVGGFNGQLYYNSVRTFDLKTKQWRDKAPMNNRRCYVSLAQLNGQIWAVGGFDGQRRLQTAERYCPSENQWYLMGSMSARRSDGHAAVLNDRIYMIGGFDGNDCLDSIEYFNTAGNRWIPGPNMLTRRSGVGATVCRNAIFAVGGFNGHVRQRSMEMLDSRMGHWKNVRDMTITRSNCGVESIGDRIYVMGGFNGHTTISSVEVYDIRADRWEMAPNMAVHRSALYCCVLSEIENMEDFVKMPRHFPLHKLKAIHQRLEAIEQQANYNT